jgi:hypothetical protein
MGEWVEIARWVALGLIGTAAVIFAPLEANQDSHALSRMP